MIDFSALGDLGNVYNGSPTRDARTGAEPAWAGRRADRLRHGCEAQLLAAGDTQGGLSLAHLAEAAANRQQDFGFRQQEATRAQGNTDRSFGLQERQVNEAARLRLA
jgi:hypothetical protein